LLTVQRAGATEEDTFQKAPEEGPIMVDPKKATRQARRQSAFNRKEQQQIRVATEVSEAPIGGVPILA
jgi:hypothetical protein